MKDKAMSRTDRFHIGQIVFSKQGRDKDQIYIVVSVDERFVYCANGEKWTYQNPKKKNPLHLQFTKTYMSSELMHEGEEIQNTDIIQTIKHFEKRK